MNRPLLWREWQEMASSVTWAFAALVFVSVTTRFVDEVTGISIAGALLGLVLGNAVTGSDRSPRVREFLLTRPVRRTRFLFVKVAISFGTLNAALLFLCLMTWFDLPARFYGLFTETNLGERLWSIDAPIFYPAGIAFANLVLALVLSLRVLAKSPSIGTAVGIILPIVTGMTVARLIASSPHLFEAIALGLTAVSLVGTIFVLSELRRRFVRLEVTGGGI